MGRNKNKRRKKKVGKWRKREEHKGDSGAQASIIRDKLQAAAPDMRAKIDKTIQRLLEIGRLFNPLPILSETAVNRLFRDPEARASGREIGEAECEHLASLFLSQPFPATATPPTPDIIQECFDLLDSVTHLYAIYYYSSAGDSEKLRPNLMINTQFVRGEAYSYHVQKQFTELAQSHDTFLAQKCGFTSGDFLALLRHAELQNNSAVNNRYQRSRDLMDELLLRYKAASGALPNGKRFEQAVAAVNDLPFREQNKEVVAEFVSLIDAPGPPEVIEVTPRNPKDAAILRLLAAKFGENQRFLQIPNWCGWPLNPSVTQTKPFIEHDRRFYLPVGPLAFRNALALLEGVVKAVDADYWQNSFLPIRDGYLEEKAVELIASILPGCRHFRKLHYSFQDEGQLKRGEVDGLVLYDDALIVIEAKAGKFSDEAKRGATKRLERDAKELLDVAFEQGKRMLNTIRNTAEVVLSDKHGREVTRVRRADFRHQFIITVSFEMLSILQTSLRAVKALGSIEGNEWPWAVCLSDLRVIAELTDHPSTFIHYLIRRTQANDVKELNTRDELDLFGFYRAGQLFFPPGEKRDYTMLMVTGFTEEIDAYYDGLVGWRPKVPKPRQPLLPSIEEFVTTLEQQRPRHFLSACLGVLDGDIKTAKEIISGLKHVQSAFVSRKRPQAMIIGFDKAREMLVIGCSPQGVCPPLNGFPSFAEAVRKTKPTKITSVFFEPPLGSGKISVTLHDLPSAALTGLGNFVDG
jgi:acyl-CoA-binding protein